MASLCDSARMLQQPAYIAAASLYEQPHIDLLHGTQHFAILNTRSLSVSSDILMTRLDGCPTPKRQYVVDCYPASQLGLTHVCATVQLQNAQHGVEVLRSVETLTLCFDFGYFVDHKILTVVTHCCA